MLSIPDLDQLKSLRVSLNLSQHDLARMAGVSQSLIAKIESKRIDPSLSNAQKIAKALLAESPKTIAVAEVMSKNLVSFLPETPVLEAINVMKKNAISQFPVVKNSIVLGRISESAILEHVESLDSLVLQEIMHSPPPLVDKETPVQAILPLLQTFSMVLVTEKGELVGIVTKADVMGLALKGKW
jgi:predicted transcriptional regulator